MYVVLWLWLAVWQRVLAQSDHMVDSFNPGSYYCPRLLIPQSLRWGKMLLTSRGFELYLDSRL